MTPDADHKVEDVQVDDISVGQITTYTFENVTADHSIHVVFEAEVVEKEYTITAVAGANGTIDHYGEVKINAGDSFNFTMIPESGFEVEDVSVDGKSVGAADSYLFENVQADHTIAASFKAVNRFQGVYTGRYYDIDGAPRGTINQLTINSTGTVADGNVFYFAEEVSLEVSFSLSGSVDATGAVSFSGTKPSSELDPERTIKIKGTIASGKIEGSWTLTEDSELVDEGYFSAEKTNP
jgi:hypothetical protein